jgi:hypothetical protein
MLGVLFTELVAATTLTNFAIIGWKLYVSNEAVVPLLTPLYAFDQLEPSDDKSISNVYFSALPLYQAMAILQISLVVSRLA